MVPGLEGWGGCLWDGWGRPLQNTKLPYLDLNAPLEAQPGLACIPGGGTTWGCHMHLSVCHVGGAHPQKGGISQGAPATSLARDQNCNSHPLWGQIWRISGWSLGSASLFVWHIITTWHTSALHQGQWAKTVQLEPLARDPMPSGWYPVRNDPSFKAL
jgi:hypothetical protein